MPHDDRITALEARVADLEQQVDTEKAERNKLLLPPLNEVRKELQLNIDYLTDRLEALKARPAGCG
jgi:hypothetical protein